MKVLFFLQLNGIDRAQTPLIQTPTFTPINAQNINQTTQPELNIALTGIFNGANGINSRITAIRNTIEQLRTKFNSICAVC